MVTRELGVVLIDPAVSLPPLVELARSEFEPGEQLLRREFRTLAPAIDVIDDFVPGIVGNPNSLQSSPAAFFERTFSSISSAMTSFF
jgi:hypothetical protein